MKKTIIVIIFIIYCLSYPLLAVEVILKGEIILREDITVLQRPSSFAKTKDGFFVISDFQAGDLKIYTSSGDFLKTFGRKGQGPDEFLGPLKISYYHPRIGIVDVDRLIISVIEIKNNWELRTIHSFVCQGGVDTIVMSSDRITVAGYYVDKNGETWSVYQYLVGTKEILPVFLTHEIFGFSTNEDFQKNYINEIVPLGLKILCEQHNEDVFGVWVSNLRILKKNLKTGEVKTFGKKTPRYLQPLPTRELKRAMQERNPRKVQKEIDKYSRIMTIGINRGLFILIYRDPKAWKSIIQVYDFDGNFQGETEIPSPSESGMFYIPRDEGFIYELTYDDTSPPGIYKIRYYKLNF
ncbi:MAG: hypothetical protein H5U06_09020 [Candidatus Aminicenantes bacterium]|nr:hypothetical protein [Candidatus Aminicenantes bacterium]